MNIKLELLKNEIVDFVKYKMEELDLDASKIADTPAILMLAEIQDVIKDDANSDFDAVEKIVCIFEKYNIDFGFRHDF